MAKQYTIEQFLAAADKVGLYLGGKTICDELVKMNQHPEIGMFRKVIRNTLQFNTGEIIQVVEVDARELLSMKYRCTNKNGITEWIFNSQSEPTTETF